MSGLLLGHIRGIRIEIHVSWVVVFLLVVTMLSHGLLDQYPDWHPMEAVITAVLAALLFFASVLAHELGHSVVAQRRGIEVKSITLFIFGGVAQIRSDSKSPQDEFSIAIAGPLVSLALALLFAAATVLTLNIYMPLTVALGWLAATNLVVAVFNMIPGFPLDGGRVLRAIVWRVTGDADRGFNVAVAGGRMVAYALFVFAFYNMLALGNLAGGLWLLLIAWFLLYLVESQQRMYSMQNHLAGLTAVDLADSDVPMVVPQTRIHDWIHQAVLHSGQRAFLVGDHRRVLGLVSMSDARKVPQKQWPLTQVDAIMTAQQQLVSVAPDCSADEVLRLISEHNLNQLPVIKDGQAVGWIDRQRLLRTVQLYLEVHRQR